MQDIIVTKKKKKYDQFLNAKVGITIFNKNGKVRTNKIINLTSLLKKESLTT